MNNSQCQRHHGHRLVRQGQRQCHNRQKRPNPQYCLHREGCGEKHGASKGGPSLIQPCDVEQMKYRNKPDRVAEHAMVELHCQRIFKKLRHSGTSKNSRVPCGTKPPSMSGQVLNVWPARRPATRAPK